MDKFKVRWFCNDPSMGIAEVTCCEKRIKNHSGSKFLTAPSSTGECLECGTLYSITPSCKVEAVPVPPKVNP